MTTGEESTRSEESAANGRKLAAVLHVILKSAILYDVSNHFWDRPLSAIDDVLKWHFAEGRGRALALTSIEKALFFNGSVIRFDATSYRAMRFVARALETMELEGLTFQMPLEAEQLRSMVAVFRDAIRARSNQPFQEALLPGLKFTVRAAGSKSTLGGEDVDPKLATVDAYAAAAARCGEFRTLFLAGGRPRLSRLKRCAQDLVVATERFPDLVVGLTQLPRLRATPAGHMVNTASFALLLSHRLKLPRRSYGEIAVNGMLSPLGASVLGDPARPADSAEVGTTGGSSAAVELMRRYGALARPALVRSAIVHESARVGSDQATKDAKETYRLGMKPHLFTRVIAVGAAYDDACHDALPDEALRRVVAQARSGALDTNAVAMLSEVLGLYPVGSTVRLSDGSTAVVVQAPRDASKRASPVVRVMSGAVGHLLDLAAPGTRVKIAQTVPPQTKHINVAHCFLL